MQIKTPNCHKELQSLNNSSSSSLSLHWLCHHCFFTIYYLNAGICILAGAGDKPCSKQVRKKSNLHKETLEKRDVANFTYVRGQLCKWEYSMKTTTQNTMLVLLKDKHKNMITRNSGFGPRKKYVLFINKEYIYKYKKQMYF